MRRIEPFVDQSTPYKLLQGGLEIQEERGLGFLKLNTRKLTSAMAKAIKNGNKQALPKMFGQSIDFPSYNVIRTAPFHWQVVGQEAEVEALRQRLQPATEGRAALATCLTNGRTAFRISGAKSMDFLSSMIAIDFHPRNFKKGRVAITRMEEIGVVVQCLEAGAEFRVVVDQSYSKYSWRLFEFNAQGLTVV